VIFQLAGWCARFCTKEVVMMLKQTQHWHVAVMYPGYEDGYENQPFEDIDAALDYANQTRETFRQDGHRVTEVDDPADDAAGVVQRYRATEEEDGTVAVVEVRPCHQRGCLPGRSPAEEPPPRPVLTRYAALPSRPR
jgi:hypothetical protein